MCAQIMACKTFIAQIKYSNNIFLREKTLNYVMIILFNNIRLDMQQVGSTKNRLERSTLIIYALYGVLISQKFTTGCIFFLYSRRGERFP